MASNELKPGDLPTFDASTALAFDALVTVVMTNIIAAAPFFAASGLNYITRTFVIWVLKFAWVPLQNLAAFFIIDQRQAAKAEAYKEAVNELKKQTDNKPLDSEEVKKAHEEFKRKLGDLISIRPR